MDIVLGIIIILIAHYIADFVFQTHTMSIKKSDSMMILLWHVSAYTITFFILFCLYGIILNEFFVLFLPLRQWIQLGIGIALVNGMLHYVIDFFTSKISRYLWNTEQWRRFFLIIGLDQLLHIILLIFSYAQMLQNFGIFS